MARHPHEPRDFTQGLVWHQGRLFESTGQYGASRIAEKDLSSGKTLQRLDLPDTLFGEGLAVLAGQFYQLSWREGIAIRYSSALKPLQRHRYRGEGWGLTTDGATLLRSDGSAELIWHEPQRFQELGRITVHDGAKVITQLNELEMAGGRLYANVWMSDHVAEIDPKTGRVSAWLDFTALKADAGISPEDERRGAVLNGLAWRPETQTLLVTGKYWPWLYEVRLADEVGTDRK